MSDRTYSREEMEEILRRALEKQQVRADDDSVGHAELVAAAREMGLQAEDIERAAKDLEGDRARVALAEESKRELAQRRAARWRGFVGHLSTYLLVITGLLVLNLMTGGAWWVQWPAFGWGIGLFAQLLGVVFARPETPHQRERRNRRERRQAERMERLAQKQARKEAARRAAHEFETAVEHGVAVLLERVAKKLDDVSTAHAQPPAGPAKVRAPSVEQPETAPDDDAAARALEPTQERVERASKPAQKRAEPD